MSVHDSESVKYFFDHIKSVWTLSAGGLAVAIALFGYILRESHVSSSLNILFGAGCVVGAGLFVYSIWNGVTAQKDLINDVVKSEQSTQPVAAVSQPLIDYYKIGRTTFFIGCTAIVSTALSFLIVNSLFGNAKSNGLIVSVKNATVITQDSKQIVIQDLTLQIPDSLVPSSETKTVEIRDLTFKVQVSGQVP
jgi:ABC-type transport system involved in multi-copper enzyme maturation permease subunit